MNPKTAIQKELSKLTYNTYFDGIPLNQIFDIIKSHGGTPIQEDGTPWSGILCGENSHTTIKITGIKTSGLNLSWHKMPSGRYEITVYLM